MNRQGRCGAYIHMYACIYIYIYNLLHEIPAPGGTGSEIGPKGYKASIVCNELTFLPI